MKRFVSFLLVCVMLISGVLMFSGFAEQPEGREFVSLLNQRRTAQGLVAAEIDSDLMDAAAIRAREQSVRVSHQRPDGTRFLTVSPKAEAECYWWFYPPANGTAQAAVNAFLNSRDHRELLMNKDVRSIGAAYYDANGRRYWVVLLSRQQASGSSGSSAPSGGASTGFVDVSGSDYFAQSVAWAVQNQIVMGTSSTTFSPYRTCTRAEVVTFLWRASGSPGGYGSAANTFRDVQRGSYYDSAVAWAVSKRIARGTGGNLFCPDATCTRAEAVTFLWRAAGSPGTFGFGRFNDVPSGSYYASAVRWAVANGITSGTSSTTFSPNDTCTRAEFVTFLYRWKT